MADSTHEADRIMSGARQSLADNRAGGRRRSIGEGSARLKAKHAKSRLTRIFVAVFAIVIAAMGFGLFVGALGFEGLFLTVLVIIVVMAVLWKFPKMDMPRRETLSRGDLRQTVARTELWLEGKRAALPAPAVPILDTIGAQLDGLGVQMEGLDENTPAMREVRKLVTEHLPEMVSSYTAIPPHLRQDARDGGTTPAQQVTDGLSRISAEIDSVTRQLAEGAIDDLAIRTKFLDYRYGQDVAALPDASATALGADNGVPLTDAGARGTALPSATDPTDRTRN
ncbi:hypothetical protein [Croceicoccus hydrothermalis]|uniref:hypothetical protein n=1 Tax=Croceicoccus hydrothermalis TaxID=2867964 RepID=UPI001EFBA2E4|nr:hypothetical protein [Croceicoccus hydrothermalis]